MTNPLVAEAKDETKAYSGMPLVESAMDLKQAIESGDWASVALGAVGTALEVLGMALDPFAAILANGVGWLIEHVGPLKEALDGLAGDPEEIKAHSETWMNVATELGAIGEDLAGMSTGDTASWQGVAADTYRQRTTDTVNLITAAQKGAEGASSGIKTAGEVVAAVRALVRDIIADLVGSLISWALQVVFTLGIGLIWVVPKVVAKVAQVAFQIADLIKKTVQALKNLVPLLKKAGELFDDAADALRKIKSSKPDTPSKPGGEGTPKSVDPPPNPKGDTTSSSGDKGPDSKAEPVPDPKPQPKSGGDSTSSSGADGSPAPKPDPKPEPVPDPKPQPKSGGDSTSSSGADGSPAPKPDPKPEPKPEPKPGGGDTAGPNGSPTPGEGGGGTAKSGDQTTPNGKPNPPREGAVSKDNMDCRGDPVEIAGGRVIVDQVDLVLPSPLVLERLHISSYRAGLWFGASWTSTVDQRLELDDEDVCYFSPDGMVLVYPRAAAGVPVLPVEGPRWPLTLAPDGTYTLTNLKRGQELRFGPLPGRGRAVLPLLSVSDHGGDRVDIDHDGLGAPRLLRHSAGYRVELNTDAGRVTSLRVLDPERDFGVLVARFGYDQQGRLTQVIDSSGIPQVFDYDQDGRMTGWQDRTGHWYRYIYDAEGRCVRTVGDQGYHDGAFTYDRERRITTHTDSLGNTTEFHLNEANQVVREVDPLGNTTISQWDRYDRLLSRTDPLGRTTTYEYTVDGELAAVVRPDGSTVRLGRHADGALTITAGDGSWQRAYPADSAPDVFGERVGVAATFDLDRQWGRPPVVPVDPVERDLFGRPRVVTDAAGGRTVLGWTVEGRRASRVGPSGRREEWRYDAEGNELEHASAPDRRTRYEYGPMDLPVARIDPTGARTTFGYDTELRLTRITNPAGLSWRYTYDAAGRLVEETDFDGRVLRFGYDAAGQLVRSVNGLGEVTTYTYDVLGNVVERRTPNGTTTYAYDPAGMLVRAADADSVVEVERDELGRVVRESVDGRAVTYAYGTKGMLRRTPSGVDSAWTFDDAGNPATLTVAGHIVRFRYDAAGREIERTTGHGAVFTQSFDAEHQLTAQTVTAQQRVVQQRRYQYHVDGQLIGVDDAISGPVRFRTDPAGRVTDVAAKDGAESYRYDPAGNVVSAQLPAADAGPRHYAGNTLQTAGAVRYTYDQQGRLTTRREAGDRTWTYTWDALDRLVGVRTPDGAMWRYRYDPLGRRTAKQRLAASGAVVEEVEFVWSGQLLVEQVHRDQRGQRLVLTWDHQPGSVRPVSQTEHLGDGVRFFTFLTDQIGTPVDMVDPGGVVAWHGTTSLWGKAKPGRPAGVSTPLRFPGQYADDETGLHYNVFRYYDPGTGRYLSQDPLGLAPAPNPAAYVPNPLLDMDPLGLGPVMSCLKGEGCDPTPRPGGGNDAGNVTDNNPAPRPVPQPDPKPDTASVPKQDSSSVPPPPKPDSSAPPPPNADSSSAPPPKPDPSPESTPDSSSNPPKDGDGKGGDDQDSSSKPDESTNDDGPSSAYDNKVNDYKQQLGIDGPVKIVNVPDDPRIALNTPVSKLEELHPGSTSGLTPDDMNKTVGELFGYPKDVLKDDPEFGGAKAHDLLDLQSGGGYNYQSNVINLQQGANDRTLFHEMGHIKQNEQGFNHANTNQQVLEYHNVLRNENNMPGGEVRDNYMHGPGGPGKNSYDDLVNDVNNLPPEMRDKTKDALKEIEDTLNTDPRYAGMGDKIKQNLADEYFSKRG